MKYFVTGGNGYIGSHLITALLKEKHEIHALVLEGTDAHCLQKKGVELFYGDIRDYDDVANSLKGCEAVFHLASYVGLWAKDYNIFHEVNVGGTQNLLNACRNENIRKVLVSSSCGIFGPSFNGKPVDENSNNFHNLRDPYELSKFQQVEVSKKYLNENMDIVIVYPTRVFGPGIKSEGNSLTAIFEDYLKGSWRIIPGTGPCYGNYIYVQDLVYGMILAMKNGKNGEGYILGGQNMTYDELFKILQRYVKKRVRVFHVPYKVMKLIGLLETFRSKWTGRKPFITVHGARKYTSDWIVSIEKARQSLGFCPSPIEEALDKTVRTFKFADNI